MANTLLQLEQFNSVITASADRLDQKVKANSDDGPTELETCTRPWTEKPLEAYHPPRLGTARRRRTLGVCSWSKRHFKPGKLMRKLHVFTIWGTCPQTATDEMMLHVMLWGKGEEWQKRVKFSEDASITLPVCLVSGPVPSFPTHYCCLALES